MNGDGGNVVSSYEPPRLWFLSSGVLHTFEGRDIEGVVKLLSSPPSDAPGLGYTVAPLGDAVQCQLWANPGGGVWPERTRLEAHAWFMETFGVVIEFEQFDAALKRDYPRTHARMVETERMDGLMGYPAAYANIHTMTDPPKPTPPPE